MEDQRHSVKSCGKAHAYCKVCRPDVADAIRGPKPPPQPGTPPCRKCGVCNDCLGLVAPDGMRVCRKCGETKDIQSFRKRGANRDRSSTCKECSKQTFQKASCEKCAKAFWRRVSGNALHCPYCTDKVNRSCGHCGAAFTSTIVNRKFCSDECRDAEVLDVRKRHYRKSRDEILEAYGGACACCEESERGFLAIDHIHGGGNKQYRELGGGGFYAWIKRNNYPPSLRLLCHNCNFGREKNGGVCPHEQQ